METPAREQRGALFFLVFGLINAGLFALFLWVGTGASRVPADDRLESASGELRALSYSRSRNNVTLEFRLDGQPERFAVPSQAGDLPTLHDTLASGKGPVTVRFDANDRRHPWWSEGNDFYLVYAIERGGKPLLSYEQSEQGLLSDTQAALWISPMWLAFAAFLLHMAWRVRRGGPPREDFA